MSRKFFGLMVAAGVAVAAGLGGATRDADAGPFGFFGGHRSACGYAGCGYVGCGHCGGDFEYDDDDACGWSGCGGGWCGHGGGYGYGGWCGHGGYRYGGYSSCGWGGYSSYGAGYGYPGYHSYGRRW